MNQRWAECWDFAAHYLERARELINSTLNDPFDALVPHSKSGIEKFLPSSLQKLCLSSSPRPNSTMLQRQMKQVQRPILSSTVLMRLWIHPANKNTTFAFCTGIRTRLMKSPRVRTSSMLNASTSIVTKIRRANISSSTWMFI